MIHLATIHWKTDKWIPIQQKYLRRYMQVDYRSYAYLNDIDEKFDDSFDVVLKEDIRSHADKLNRLAERICHDNQDDDYILFLDGDAFPIAPIEGTFLQEMNKYTLTAIQRIENNGDIQPHPSFAMVKIGKWKEINGTWERGYTWPDRQGRSVTDLGGELLRILETNKLDWLKITRSNRMDLHPLYFGIYGNLIYHHGAGFRRGKGGRVSRYTEGEMRFDNNLWNHLTARIPSERIRAMINPKERWLKKLEAQMVALSERFYHEILADELFYTKLMGGDED